MAKTYKIIQFFGNETKKEISQQTKPSLKDVLCLLYYSEEPDIIPSSICVQVFIYDFPKLNNALGIEVKFIPPEGVLVQIFNIAKPNPKTITREVSKFFLISFLQYRKMIKQHQFQT